MSGRGKRLGESLLTLAAGIAAAIPVIAATVKAVQAGWVPVADRGIIATRAHDVFTSHMPLVGQYTLAGEVTGRVTHSLGPMLFWLLAPAAYDGSDVGMTVTMGAFNTLCIVGCVVLARRRGGRALMVMTALAIALMCQSLAAETFHDVWNPSAGLFPFTLLIFLCWSLACGEYRLLPLTAVVASFVVQTHLTYLPPTLGLLAVGLGGLATGWIAGRRDGAARTNTGALVDGAPVATGTPPTQARDAGTTAERISIQALDAEATAKRIPTQALDANATAKQIPTQALDANATAKQIPTQALDANATAKPIPIQALDANTTAEQIPTQAVASMRRGVRWGALSRRHSALLWCLLTVVVTAFCWSATIDGQLTEHPGNLTLVIESATRHRAALGDGVGWHAVVRAVGITPWWLQTPKSRWQRKYEVRTTPSALATNSTIAMLAALVLVALVALARRRRDLATLALTALVLCPALGAVAASTPTPRRLSATLGYTLWWGSQAGMVVWLALAWALLAVVAWAAQRAARAARPAGRLAAARVTTLGSVILTLAGIGAAAAVGNAVAAQGTPDEHAVTYEPIKAIDARLARLIPRGGSVLLEGELDGATMPVKPAVRYFLVVRGTRVLAPGSSLRLGSWYELYKRPYREAIYLSDVPRLSGRGTMKNVPLAFEVSFREGSTVNTVYVWRSRRPGR